MPALLSAFLSLHTVSKSPVFVFWSAWRYLAHYSVCNPSVNLGHNVHWCTLTKAPLCHVYLSFPWKWKAEDRVTSNEKRTSHPIGFSSPPGIQATATKTSTAKLGLNGKRKSAPRINMHARLLCQQQIDKLPATVLFSLRSGDNWTLHDPDSLCLKTHWIC